MPEPSGIIEEVSSPTVPPAMEFMSATVESIGQCASRIVAEFAALNEAARRLALDILRRVARSFFSESDLVKLQALNLASKLHISTLEGSGEGEVPPLLSAAQVDRLKPLIAYVFNLASRIKEIAPICLNGLLSLLSNRNESIVAQSIVALRSQIINKDQAIITMIFTQVVKWLEMIREPAARATIAWIVAEFAARNEAAQRQAATAAVGTGTVGDAPASVATTTTTGSLSSNDLPSLSEVNEVSVSNGSVDDEDASSKENCDTATAPNSANNAQLPSDGNLKNKKKGGKKWVPLEIGTPTSNGDHPGEEGVTQVCYHLIE